MKTDTISSKIIESINAAWSEIDEWRVQLALGKAEAKDLYEQSKKKFNQLLHDLSQDIAQLKEDKDVVLLLNRLESLRVQLALGKAETKQLFEEQYEKLKTALHELDTELRKNKHIEENYAKVHLEFEKFKIKLELLHLHYKLLKVKTGYQFEDKKKDLLSKLELIKDKMLAKEKEGKQKWDHFQEELGEAYEHLRSAFRD